MKRLLALLMAVMVLILSACNFESKDSQDEKERKRTTKEEAAIFTFYINTSSGSGLVNANDLSVHQPTVKTIEAIIKGNETLQEVMEHAEISLKPDELREMIVMTTTEDSSVITVGVVTDDHALSMRIAQALCDIIPRRLSEIIDGISIKIVDSPYIDKIEVQ